MEFIPFVNDTARLRVGPGKGTDDITIEPAPPAFTQYPRPGIIESATEYPFR